MEYESPLTVLVKGALAGLLGTAVITVGMRYAPQLLSAAGLPPPPPAEEPPAKLAQKLAAGVFETDVDPATKQTAGQAIHWAYGAGWGALYGIMQGSLHLPHWLHGTLFGGIVAAIASTLVPAMRLTPPASEQPDTQKALQLASRLVYGWVTAFVFGRLEHKR